MSYNLLVKLNDGSTLNLALDPSDDVSFIKEKLWSIKGVEPSHIRILCKGNELNDEDQTLDECGINNESVLFAVIKKPREKKIKKEVNQKPNVEKTQLDSELDESKVKTVLADSEMIYFKPYNEIVESEIIEKTPLVKPQSEIIEKVPEVKLVVPIKILLNNGNEHIQDIDLNKPLSCLKENIADKENVGFSDIKFMPKNGVILLDEECGSYYGIVKESIIYAMIFKKQIDKNDIKVEGYSIPLIINSMEGKSVTVLANPSGTVNDQKKIIQVKLGVEPERQSLVVMGKVQEDQKTLNFYNIQKNQVIFSVFRACGGNINN